MHRELDSIADGWLVLRLGTAMIRLFEGMLETTILTSTPTDVRSIGRYLKDTDIAIYISIQTESSPTHCA